MSQDVQCAIERMLAGLVTIILIIGIISCFTYGLVRLYKIYRERWPKEPQPIGPRAEKFLKIIIITYATSVLGFAIFWTCYLVGAWLLLRLGICRLK